VKYSKRFQFYRYNFNALIVTALGQQPLDRSDLEKNFPVRNAHHARQEDCFLSPFVHRRRAVAHPEPTKVFLKLSPEMAMMSAPFDYTHPPPPVPHILLNQNLSPKEHCGK